MGRIIEANKSVLYYLEKLSTSSSFIVGLVFGQVCEGKHYIVHAAKTSLLPSQTLKNVSDISDLWMADHAKQATKMLSGGMHVIGIFLVSESDILASSVPIQLRSLLNKLNDTLSSEYLHGNPENNERILLNYCTKSKNLKCKIYDIQSSSVNSADVKFVENKSKWTKLECKYEMNEVYHLDEETHQVDLKKQMSIILKDVNNNLKSSIFLYDGELKKDEEILDSIGKKKKILRPGKITYTDSENDDEKPITITILQSCVEKLPGIHIKNINNQIKIVGQILCVVWLNPMVSFKMATNSIIQDIMRSLSTRLEMHCDSLIEEEHKEDANSIHEPPRRVIIAIAEADITVSDYLFPGEGAEEAKNSVEEILDIKLTGSPDKIQDVEGSIDITNYGGNISQIVDGKSNKEDKEHSRMLFFIGSVFALIVLLVSVIIHFIIKHL